MELERGRSAGPTDRRRSTRGEGRRRTAAGRSGRRRRSTPAGTCERAAPAARHDRREARRQSAQTRPRPQPSQTAHRLGQRQRRRPAMFQREARRGRVGIGSIYCPPWPPTTARRGRRLDAIAVAAGAAPAGAHEPERALAARRGRAAHGRAPGVDPARAGAGARLVAAVPGAGAERARSSVYPKARDRRSAGCEWLSAQPRASERRVVGRPRWALRGRRRPQSSPPTPDDRARPAPSSIWANMVLHGVPIRRRCSSAGNAPAAGRRLRRCSPASARAPSRSCARLYRALGLAGADARLHRHARPRRHAGRGRLRRPGDGPGDADACAGRTPRRLLAELRAAWPATHAPDRLRGPAHRRWRRARSLDDSRRCARRPTADLAQLRDRLRPRLQGRAASVSERPT